MPETPAIQTVEKYGYSINLHDFGQDTFESYQMQALKAARHAFFEFGQSGEGVTAQAYERGETVRVAIRLKIISGIELNEVGKLKPYVVTWIAEELKKHVKAVVSEPADPKS